MQPLPPFPLRVSITHTRCSVSRARREGGREVENSEHRTVSERSPKIAAARLIWKLFAKFLTRNYALVPIFKRADIKRM